MEKKLVWRRDYRQNRCICTLRTRETLLERNLPKSRDENSPSRYFQSRTSRIIFAISKSIIVSGTDLFANLLKLSRFFSLLRIFRATMFDAVPIGVAIPPIPVPTAKAQAKGAIETPEKLDIAPITGMKTVTNGTLSTIWLMRAVVHRTKVTARARFPLDSRTSQPPSWTSSPVLAKPATRNERPPKKKKKICQSKGR